MFEEDYERCFICQLPCKGLYCSSQCRLQDKGGPSPAVKPTASPARFTSQIPINLSPMLRPTHHTVAPSPRLPPTDSSSSSSNTSSPIQSPHTNPASGADSPQKGSFDLPPLAYPKEAPMPSSLAFAGSMPVKIPNLISRPPPSAAHTPASNSTIYPIGASIDTLKFGRKPGLTNSVTSPNALLPQCACGKPANHRGRAVSKDRGIESGLANFVLGPSLHDGSHRKQRIVSDSAGQSSHLAHQHATSGYNTPDLLQYADGRGGASLLSRSRSDPIPPSPEAHRNVIAPTPHRAPASRRASNTHAQRQPAFSPSLGPIDTAVAPASFRASGISTIAPPAVASPPQRGRSRERAAHPLGTEISAGLLNHPPEREHPPSRSTHRRSDGSRERERERERERGRTGAPAMSPSLVDPSQITPSWNRRTSPDAGPGEGVTPVRKNGSGQHSPVQASDRKQEEMRRASNQLGAVFGVAAG